MRKVILVIDDDADDRELFREALHETDSNAEFLSATNGQEALDLLSKPGQILPDIIFLDLNMPRLDGRQCLLRLRAMPRFDKVPIIIFTTLKPADDGKEYRRLGADMCVTKPMLYGDLQQTIRSILSVQWKAIDLSADK